MAIDPAVLKRVQREMRDSRARDAMERVREMEALSGRYPRLREIDAELHTLLMEQIESGADAERSGEAALRRERLIGERREILRLAADGQARAGAEHVRCAACADELYIDGRPCRCLAEACAQEQTRLLGRSLNLAKMCFENFDLYRYSGKIVPEYGISPRANMEILLEKCEGYANAFCADGKSLFLNGGVGTGKTFLSACIAGRVSARGFWTVYETAIDLFALLEAQKFDREEADPRAQRAYLACDLLVIDDLGTEFLSSFVQTALYHVVNRRLCAGKNTIINSNLTLDDFHRRYAPQTVSRIRGEYETLFFFGADLRAE